MAVRRPLAIIDRLSRGRAHCTSARVPDLFDTKLIARRHDRAARDGPELFLLNRAFDDCLERISLVQRRFEHALLIGGRDPAWVDRLRGTVVTVDCAGDEFEGRWQVRPKNYDLVIALSVLDTINDLALALHLVCGAMRPSGLFIGAFSGGDTLPRLRAAMRAADAVAGTASPHVHPRIAAAAVAPLLEQAGFVQPVVDVERVRVSYRSLDRLISDLRSMAATNALIERPRFIGKIARAAAIRAFAEAGDGERTTETFEIVHFASWTPE